MTPSEHYTVRCLGPGEGRYVTEMLSVFGEAFDDVATYSGAQPGAHYVERLLGSDTFIAIAALKGDTVVGGLAAYVLQKFEQERSEIYVYDLAVADAHRRKGLATALIGELRRIGAERGAAVIFVQADRGDAPAIALYSKLGVREDVLHFDIAIPRPSPADERPHLSPSPQVNPIPSPSPPAAPNPDVEHLRLLAIFHYVVAGLGAFFASLPLLHVAFGLMMVLSPQMLADGQGGAAPPAFVGYLFMVGGAVFVLLGWAAAIVTFLSGRYLAQRKNRTFSFVIAAILCMFVPIGTILGIFTLIVLSRDSVQRLYRTSGH